MDNSTTNKLALSLIANYLKCHYRGTYPPKRRQPPDPEYEVRYRISEVPYKDIPFEPVEEPEYDEVIDNRASEVLEYGDSYVCGELESPDADAWDDWQESPDFVDSDKPYYYDASLYQQESLPETDNPQSLQEEPCPYKTPEKGPQLPSPCLAEPKVCASVQQNSADLRRLTGELNPGPPFNKVLLNHLISKDIDTGDFQKRANMSRQVFSKLAGGISRPKKETALSCVMGLGLSLDEAEGLLNSAGYSFSNADLTDMIVKCFVEHKDYDIDELNDILVNTYGLPYLGTKEYKPRGQE